jgi:hypothetical protein
MRSRDDPADPFANAFFSPSPYFAMQPGLASTPVVNFFPGLPADPSPEKVRIIDRLLGFNPKEHPSWAAIATRFGATVNQRELVSIARVLATHSHVPLDRDAKRRKSVLLKWFAENWGAIAPFIDSVVLEEVPNA